MPPSQSGARSLFSPSRIFSMRHVRWLDVDWHVLAIALTLLIFGMTFVEAMVADGFDEGAGGVNFSGHLQKVILTLPLIPIGMLMRAGWLRKHAHWIYFATLCLLMLVPFIGEERNNAKRWIRVPGVFDLQPSEFAKLGVILMLAKVLARNRLKKAKDWVRPALCALVPMAMVARQPDLGTALTIVPVTMGMLYIAGGSGRIMAGVTLAGLALGVFAWQARFGHEYQMRRLDTWAESYEADSLIDMRNRYGFHVYHARTSIGDGGFLGRGLGKGVANQTGHLPERDSDSIFAVMAGEAGFLGVVALLLLYLLMILLLMGSATGLRDRFARLVVGGVALYFAAHVLINASVNLGLLPMTGLTLPLFSTGGSSLLTTFMALGLALGLASHREALLDRDAFRTY